MEYNKEFVEVALCICRLIEQNARSHYKEKTDVEWNEIIIYLTSMFLCSTFNKPQFTLQQCIKDFMVEEGYREI